MSKDLVLKFDLEDALVRLGKISNNTLPSDITEFTIPCTELVISEDQGNMVMRDKYFGRCVFNTVKDVKQVCEWVIACGGEIPVPGKFQLDYLCIEGDGNTKIEFESEGDPKDPDEYIPAARLSNMALKPVTTGVHELLFSFSVRPGRGKENLFLQDHQNRPVKITFGDARLIRKESRQAELALGSPNKDATSSDPLPPAEGVVTGAAMGRAIVAPESEDGAESSPLDTTQRADEAGESVAPETSEEATSQAGIRPDVEAESQASTERPGEIVDKCDELNGTPPGPDALNKSQPTAEDLAAFERGVQEKVESHKGRHPEVLDGRSERVKNEDRKRTRRSAH
jgi:hypothetical protein